MDSIGLMNMLEWIASVCKDAESGDFTDEEIINKIIEIENYREDLRNSSGDMFLINVPSYDNLRIRLGLLKSIDEMFDDYLGNIE